MLREEESAIINAALKHWRAAVEKHQQASPGTTTSAAPTTYREVARHRPPFGERLGSIAENTEARKLLASLLLTSWVEPDIANFILLTLSDAAVLVPEGDTVAGLKRVLGLPEFAIVGPEAQARLKTTLGAQTLYPNVAFKGTKTLIQFVPIFTLTEIVLQETCRGLITQLAQWGSKDQAASPRFESEAQKALAARNEVNAEDKAVAVGYAFRQLFQIYHYLHTDSERDIDEFQKKFNQRFRWRPDQGLPFPFAAIWTSFIAVPAPPAPAAVPVFAPSQLVVEIVKGKIAKFPDGTDAKDNANLAASDLPWGLYRTTEGPEVLVADPATGMTPEVAAALIAQPLAENPGACVVKSGARDWVVAHWPFDMESKFASQLLVGQKNGAVRRYVRVLDSVPLPVTLTPRDATLGRALKLTATSASWVETGPVPLSPRIYWRLQEADNGLRPALFIHVPPDMKVIEARMVVGDAIDETMEAWAYPWSKALFDVRPNMKVTLFLDGVRSELRAPCTPPALFSLPRRGQEYHKVGWKDLVLEPGTMVVTTDTRSEVIAADAQVERVPLLGQGWERFGAWLIKCSRTAVPDIRVDGKRMVEVPPTATVKLGAVGGVGDEELRLLAGDSVLITVAGYLPKAVTSWSREGKLIAQRGNQRHEERVPISDERLFWEISGQEVIEKLDAQGRQNGIVTLSLADVPGVTPGDPARIQLVPVPVLTIEGKPEYQRGIGRIALKVKVDGVLPDAGLEIGDPAARQWHALSVANGAVTEVSLRAPDDVSKPSTLSVPLRVSGVTLPAAIVVKLEMVSNELQVTATTKPAAKPPAAKAAPGPDPMAFRLPTPGAGADPMAFRLPTLDDMKAKPAPAPAKASDEVPTQPSLAGRPIEPTPARTAPLPPPQPPPAPDPEPVTEGTPQGGAVVADPRAHAKDLLDRYDEVITSLNGMVGHFAGFKPVNESTLSNLALRANGIILELSLLVKQLGGTGLDGVTGRAAADELVSGLIEKQETDRRMKQLVKIAEELANGQLEHRLTKRLDQLEQLRGSAIAELKMAAGASPIPSLPPAPEETEWLPWVWSLRDPKLTETLEAVRSTLPELAGFLENVEPAFWKSGTGKPS